MFTSLRRLFFVIICSAPALAFAKAISIKDINVETPPGSNSVIYLTVESATNDTLLSIHSDCCKAVEIHDHIMDGGVIRMRRVDAVPLPAGEPVKFQPYGLHVMLFGLKKSTAPVNTIDLTFNFANTPAQTITVSVPDAPDLHEGRPSPTTHTH